MNLNIYNQLFNLAIFIIVGIIIGILFDIFRIMRKSFKTPDIVTDIEDIIFWISTGAILLFSIFIFNNGEIRIYVFIGLIFGLILYLLTLSKFFIKFSVIIVTFIKKIIYYPFRIISNFITKFIFRPFYFIYCKISTNIANIFKKIKYKTSNNKISNICNKIDQ